MNGISIITVVRNSAATIGKCMDSILAQRLQPLEYILIDGASTDGTLDVVNQKTVNNLLKLVSEPDKGIYDAMNSGLAMARGAIIGFLNADDMYAHDHVLANIVKVFEDPSIDACYRDLVYVDRENTEKIIRYWKSKPYRADLFEKCWVPAHPTFFARREIYEKYGTFNLDYRNAADADLMMRFISKHRIKVAYLPEVTVKMRIGGASNRSLANIVRQNIELRTAARENGVRLSRFYIFHKLFEKLPQFFLRPDDMSDLDSHYGCIQQYDGTVNPVANATHAPGR